MSGYQASGGPPGSATIGVWDHLAMDRSSRDDETAVVRLISVNVGLPKEVDTGQRIVETAIWKAPVEGRVKVRHDNLEGDRQADLTVHGGPDKAVAFGENLTTEGVDVSGAVLGERWRIGTTLLEVVQPRLPCFKLGLKMGDPTFLKRFALASRPGAYLKIIEEGDLGAGDPIEVDLGGRPDHGVSVRLVADAMLVDHSLIPRARAAPQLISSLRAQMAELG
jgi:MOSC domain-containing protein YiiM